jgi:hypothetical protein
MALDQVGVVAVDGSQQVAQRRLGDRVQPPGGLRGRGDQGKGEIGQVPRVAVAAGEHGLHCGRVADHVAVPIFAETNRLT